ncbi:hypothetical protein CASFOL_011109 [Castilleja foliolosa]|uniref:Uncharacterized protein n=1 Tax=Castilleja foliolosa TaxID=1961234 RepID=A0ABD3DVK4_9LAMI
MLAATHVRLVIQITDRVSSGNSSYPAKRITSLRFGHLSRKVNFSGIVKTHNIFTPAQKGKLFVIPNTGDGHPSVSVIIRTINGKIHRKNTLQQLERVGPKSVGVCLLTSAFVGMTFTIQFVRDFTRLGLNRSIGGVLALAFSRELSPVVTYW